MGEDIRSLKVVGHVVLSSLDGDREDEDSGGNPANTKEEKTKKEGR
jgi:hypothetical protein